MRFGFISLAIGVCSAAELSGCGGTSVSAQEASASIGEPLGATREYIALKKAEFQDRIEVDLEGLRQRKVELERRAAELGGESVAAFRRRKGEVEKKEEVLVRRLALLRAASHDTWAEMQEGVLRAAQECRSALEDMASER